MSNSRRIRRGLAAAVACATVVMPVHAKRSSAQTATAPVTISGEGSWALYRYTTPLQNDMIGAASPVDIQYVPTGTRLGRSDYVAGNLDYVISGVPFQQDELANLQGGEKAVVAAPVAISALGMLLAVPPHTQFVGEVQKPGCDPNDPNLNDPSDCFTQTPYVDSKGAPPPIKVPLENLASMAMASSQLDSDGVPIASWSSPGVLGNTPFASWFGFLPQTSPLPMNRSDPDESMYYLQTFVQQAAPNTWAFLKKSDTRVAWEPTTERLPRQLGFSRQGPDQQVETVGLNSGSANGVNNPGANYGAVVPVLPSALGDINDTTPAVPTVMLPVQNANGDWVQPTTASINAGIAAGGDKPLYALSNKVPNAYPLSWVEYLYAPSSGLSIDKTEAISAYIRYLATAGQKYPATVGEGQLTKDLTSQALDAANTLVKDNCVGADRKVVTSTDPGPYAPASVKDIGSVAHCVATGAAPESTSTTTAATTAPVGDNSSALAFSQDLAPLSDTSGSGVSSAPTGAASSGSSSGGSSGGSGTSNNLSAVQAAARSLPYAVTAPADSPGAKLDDFATRIAGALVAALLVGRKPKPARKP